MESLRSVKGSDIDQEVCGPLTFTSRSLCGGESCGSIFTPEKAGYTDTLGMAVQRVDGAIHRINCYPCSGQITKFTIHWIVHSLSGG